MKEESTFPYWFKNILIGIGVFSIFYAFCDNEFLYDVIPSIILFYPVVLLSMLFPISGDASSYKDPELIEIDKVPFITGKQFFNISVSIIAFFTLIFLVQSKTFVEHSGIFSIGSFKIFSTNSYPLKIVIYILKIIYFVLVGGYLSYRIKFWIVYSEGHVAFIKGKKLMKYKSTVSKSTITGNDIEYTSSASPKDAKAALKFFDEAIEKGYNEADVFTFKALAFGVLGLYSDVIENYDKSIKLDSNDASVYFLRGRIKESLGDYDGSTADFKEAIRLSKFHNYNNMYWNNHWQKVGYDSATECYEESLFHRTLFHNEEQDDPEAQYNLARMYYYGEGTSPNKKRAARWMKKAYDNGYQEAKNALDKLELWKYEK